MKHSPDYPEDLVMLARRGRLSSEQLAQLEHGVRVSAALRVADEVGRAFDRVADVHEGDEQRIAKWVDAFMAGQRVPAARRWHGWRLGLAAAIFLGSASAAGLAGWRHAARAESTPAQHSTLGAATAAVRVAAGARPARASSPGGHGSLASPRASADTLGREGADSSVSGPHAPGRPDGIQGELRGSASIRSTDTPESDARTPGELFSQANAARRQGQQKWAIALYAELQRAHPRSAEASMSHLSMGRLLLARGQAARALAQFSGYLAGRGPLQEEAMLGKARALAQLGRRSEERAAWKALLTRCPSSMYAAEARERLGEAERSREP